jgi:hypothetical protein
MCFAPSSKGAEGIPCFAASMVWGVENMTETAQIILALIIMVMVFILAKKIQGMKINRAFRVVINDLKQQKALDPSSAVTLPYATRAFFQIGLRDYRPKAIFYLVQSGIVGMTENKQFYLIKDVSEEMLRGKRS